MEIVATNRNLDMDRSKATHGYRFVSCFSLCFFCATASFGQMTFNSNDSTRGINRGDERKRVINNGHTSMAQTRTSSIKHIDAPNKNTHCLFLSPSLTHTPSYHSQTHSLSSLSLFYALSDTHTHAHTHTHTHSRL